MFSAVDVMLIIGLVVGPIATISITIYKVNIIKNKLEYWETKGLDKLKLYIQQELSIMDRRYEQRFEIMERRITVLEEIVFKMNGRRSGKGNNNA